MSAIMEALGLEEDTYGIGDRVVSAQVLSASKDVAVLQVTDVDGKTRDAIMPVTEWYPHRRWTTGDRYQLMEVSSGSRPMLSAARPALAVALLAGVSPEVRSGAVRVMSVARNPGVRVKIAVAATSEGFDPIAACVGKGACRVKYLTAALQGERVDIVAWHPDQETYLANSLAPARVDRVEITDNTATAYAPPHLMSAAVGAGGLNSRLAGELTGLTVTIQSS